MHTLRKYWITVAVAALLLWWLMTGDIPILAQLQNMIGRGRRLSMSSLDSGGNIVEATTDLVASASATLGRQVSQDAYDLARIADSEHQTADLREKAAIMQITINESQASGRSIHAVATGGKGYGRQAGRWCSTASDPYEQTLLLAENVLGGTVADETRDSRHWVHVTGFASLGAYKALCLKWQDQMQIVPVKLPGINAFRMFLPESQYAAEDTLPEVTDGIV
jgi:hypothetical protein